jgi:hypothetical protein
MAPSGERSEEPPSLNFKSIELAHTLQNGERAYYRLGHVLEGGSHCMPDIL